ncbi:unnamed protein product [Nezara viridula]|uniref:Uncharacterized protein n=1 Tax=Nezara viridula TaxID=85310 RepID=A0A9P0MXY1_NEZVI|nr:unnamed protein product [Nezara viridula]
MVWAWLGEENARLLLLAGVLVAYMCFGAVLFNFVEDQPGVEGETVLCYCNGPEILGTHPRPGFSSLFVLYLLIYCDLRYTRTIISP